MHLRTFLSVAIFCIAIGVPVGAYSNTPVSALPTCEGALQVRPTYVMFACGDGGVYATGVRWSGWGSSFATATATMHANDCTPNCAEGHFHVYAAYLAATGSQRCSHGATAYRSVAYVPRSKGVPTRRSHLDWETFDCH